MLQALLNLLALDMRPDEAVAAPRLHVEDEKLSLEPGFPEQSVQSIERIFAEVERWPGKNMFFGGARGPANRRRVTGRRGTNAGAGWSAWLELRSAPGQE